MGYDRFEHGLIVRSYSFDAVSTGISTIPLESFRLFRESGHPQLISSKSAFPRPSEWSFLEGDEVYNLDDPIVTEWWEPQLYKSGFIHKLRDNAAELYTKECIVIVPWMAICKVVRIGDFVKVTGGLLKEQKGWVDGVDLAIQVVDVIRMVDEGKPTSDHVEVRPILNECPLMLIFLSDVPGAKQSIKAFRCSPCAWIASEACWCDSTFRAGSMDQP